MVSLAPSAGDQVGWWRKWTLGDYIQNGVLALLFLAFLADFLGDYSGLDKRTEAILLVILVLVPGARILKFFGVEFEREARLDLQAVKTEFAKVENRLVNLETALGVKAPAYQTLATGKPAARDVILEMLEDRAYNMRSEEALTKATGLSADELSELCKKIPRVRKVIGTDGRTYYGFRDRVQLFKFA